jgi:glycosyltransferase involved in cell wall biosynthesis
MTKPLRIALIMQGGRGWMGGMEYIRNIILALSSLPRDMRNTFEIFLLASRSTDPDFMASVKPYLKKVYVVDELVPPTVLNRLKWLVMSQVFRVPDNRYGSIIEKNKFDFIYPCTNPYDGYPVRKLVAWIPDFQHKYLTEFFTSSEIKGRDNMFGLMAKNAAIVVLSSKSAEDDFKRFYPGAAFKSRVLPFKTSPQARWFELNPLDIQAKYNLPDKFFIISNQFWQHKNHLTVFKALKLLKDNAINPVIVCTGHIYDYRQPEYSDTILQAIHQSGLASQVYLLGLIPKIDQIQLLRRSIALLQPSLFEGWSTVVEDARFLGKPVILSDIPVHIEQNPPRSRYFRHSSPESLAPLMAEYWESFSPGPDLEQESIARETNKREVLEFAENFIAIAKSTRYAD